MFYIYGTPVSEADGQRLVNALRSTDDAAALAAADAITKGVHGDSTVPLTREMQVAVRSALENSQTPEGLHDLRHKLARTTATVRV